MLKVVKTGTASKPPLGQLLKKDEKNLDFHQRTFFLTKASLAYYSVRDGGKLVELDLSDSAKVRISR